jgi:hypothetical protein
LFGDGGKGRALLLGFDNTQGFTIHEQEIIARAGGERNFAQRNATAGGEINGLVVLNDPARRDEHRINLLAGLFFRSHADPSTKRGGVAGIVSRSGI